MWEYIILGIGSFKIWWTSYTRGLEGDHPGRNVLGWGLPTGDLVVSKYGGHHTLGDLTGTFRGQMSGDEGIGNDVDAM